MVKSISHRAELISAEAAFFVLSKAKELEAKGKKIIHLEIGEPDFDTPKYIKDAAIESLLKGETHYTPSAGLPELRQAIAENAEKERGIDIDWKKNVVVTTGAKQAIFTSLTTILNEGDEVLYPNPGFPAYESTILFSGAKPIPVILEEENEFRMIPEKVNELITNKTKAIILNSPHNPCGSVLKKEDVKGIAEIAEDNDLYLISDEIYKHIIFDGLKHYSAACFGKGLENTIIIDGLSKSYAMTGWRCGYVIAPEEVTKRIIKLVNVITSCMGAFIQKAGIAALKGSMEAVNEMVKKYDERRKIMISEFEKIENASLFKPRGAFYGWINVKKPLEKKKMNSEKFIEYLMEKYGVAVLHGSSLGKYGEGYIRICFATSEENIINGIRLLGKAVNELMK